VVRAADDLFYVLFEEINIEAVSLFSITELFCERNLLRAAFLKKFLGSTGCGIDEAYTRSSRSEILLTLLPRVIEDSCTYKVFCCLHGGFSRFFKEFIGVHFFSKVALGFYGNFLIT
jgi:hypothetical protein